MPFASYCRSIQVSVAVSAVVSRPCRCWYHALELHNTHQWYFEPRPHHSAEFDQFQSLHARKQPYPAIYFQPCRAQCDYASIGRGIFGYRAPSSSSTVCISLPLSPAVSISEHHRTPSSSRLPAQLARCQPRPHLPATSFDARRLARSAARRAIRSSAHLARPCRLVRRRPPSPAPCARGQRARPCACDGKAWHPLALS